MLIREALVSNSSLLKRKSQEPIFSGTIAKTTFPQALYPDSNNIHIKNTAEPDDEAATHYSSGRIASGVSFSQC